MFSRHRQGALRCTLLILINLSSTSAWRNFNLIFTKIQCSANTDFLVNSSCALDSSPIPRINIEAQQIKEIRDLRMAFSVDLERPNKESISLIKITNKDSCILMSSNITQPLLKIYKEILRKAGTIPTGCPIPAGFRYKFRNITLNPDYLPLYVPEASFKVVIVFSEGKLQLWHIITLGKISNKKSKKGPRII